jgi:vacuolar protein sorting-associated protein 54
MLMPYIYHYSYNVFQANNFIKKFHTEKINKLQLLLDSENWRQKVVPSEFQHLVEYIQNTGIYGLYYDI